MPAACPCNHMFTAGINRNHNNRTSLPPLLIVCYSCCCLFGTGCLARSSRVMIHFHTYILLCRISFFSGLRLRMPVDRPCNRMFTAGISRSHNNCTSLPPSLIVCYSCRSLRDGMSVRIIPSHDILSCQYSIMSNFSFNGLQTRMSADRSCNRMFTAGISRNHDNCTSLPPSLIVCYSCRSLRDGMSVRIIPSHDILSCQYSIMSNFSFNGLQTRMSADRSCNRMFTAGISRNHDNCTSLPPSLKLNCAARRLLFSWENVREADQLES